MAKFRFPWSKKEETRLEQINGPKGREENLNLLKAMEKADMQEPLLAQKSGVKFTTIYDLVNGNANINNQPRETLEKLSRALRSPVEQLLNGHKEEVAPGHNEAEKGVEQLSRSPMEKAVSKKATTIDHTMENGTLTREFVSPGTTNAPYTQRREAESKISVSAAIKNKARENNKQNRIQEHRNRKYIEENTRREEEYEKEKEEAMREAVKTVKMATPFITTSVMATIAAANLAKHPELATEGPIAGEKRGFRTPRPDKDISQDFMFPGQSRQMQ